MSIPLAHCPPHIGTLRSRPRARSPSPRPPRPPGRTERAHPCRSVSPRHWAGRRQRPGRGASVGRDIRSDLAWFTHVGGIDASCFPHLPSARAYEHCTIFRTTCLGRTGLGCAGSPCGPRTATTPLKGDSGHHQAHADTRRTTGDVYVRAARTAGGDIARRVPALHRSALTTPQRAAAADPGYLMAHFTGEGRPTSRSTSSHSTDGLHWSDLNGGGMVLRSTVGTRGVRDPALVRSPDGDQYWIIATDLCIGCGRRGATRPDQRQPQPRGVGVH